MYAILAATYRWSYEQIADMTWEQQAKALAGSKFVHLQDASAYAEWFARTMGV